MSQQSDLIDTLAAFLQALGEPIHYKELTDVIIGAGLWKPYGKQPDQIVYSAMHQDVKKRGEMSAFVFMGKGVFVFSDVPGALIVERPEIQNNTRPKDPAKRAGDLPYETKARREAMAEDARCGNCTYIEYSAVEEFRHETGFCQRWEHSGRICTKNHAEPCDNWSMRTLAQREEDANVRNNHRIYLIKIAPLIAPGKARI